MQLNCLFTGQNVTDVVLFNLNLLTVLNKYSKAWITIVDDQDTKELALVKLDL